MKTSTLKNSVKAILVAVVAAHGVIGHASNSNLYRLASQTTSTGYSGSSTTVPVNQAVGSASSQDFRAINRVTNWENMSPNNHPCEFKVKMRHLNNYNDTSADVDIGSNCNKDKITVGFSDTETYVRGIQVCRHNSRVKGLKVWGSKLNRSTGALTNVAPVTDTRPNCSQWGARQYCPAGQIATQLKVQADTMAIYYTGAALVCREVVPK